MQAFPLENTFLKKERKYDSSLETTTKVHKYCEFCLEVQKSFVKRNQKVVFFVNKNNKLFHSAPKYEVQIL